VDATALALFAARLDELLSSEDPYHALDLEFLRIDEIRSVAPNLGMTDEGVQQMIVALYREFSSEIVAFLRGMPVPFPGRSMHAVAS
jgi:hypothetical protein